MLKHSDISRFFPQLIHHPIGIATLSAAGFGEKSAFARSGLDLGHEQQSMGI